ncbi:hypothetical protein FRB96_009447 [Tulasnella sp. 330]|nr:hypothetical protein FRB96_009447 [Tulasnella sp. 330]
MKYPLKYSQKACRVPRGSQLYDGVDLRHQPLESVSSVSAEKWSRFARIAKLVKVLLINDFSSAPHPTVCEKLESLALQHSTGLVFPSLRFFAATFGHRCDVNSILLSSPFYVHTLQSYDVESFQGLTGAMIEETSTTRRFGVGGAALPPPYRLHLSGVRCAAQSPRLSLQGAESTTPAYHQHAIWKDAGAYGNIQRTGEAKDHPPQRPRSSLNEGDERPHGLGPRNLVELNISQSGEEATDLDVLIAALPETEAELEVPELTLNNRVTIPYEHIRPLTRLPKLKVIALTIRTLLAALSTSDGISGTFDDDASMDHEAAAANEPMLPEIGLCFFGRGCLKLKLLKIRPYRRPSFQDDAVVASEDDFDMDPSAPSKRVLDVVTFLADICRREMELRVSESKRWTDDVAWTHVRGAYPVWRDLGRERMWIKASLTIYFICRRGELSVHSETEL